MLLLLLLVVLLLDLAVVQVVLEVYPLVANQETYQGQLNQSQNNWKNHYCYTHHTLQHLQSICIFNWCFLLQVISDRPLLFDGKVNITRSVGQELIQWIALHVFVSNNNCSPKGVKPLSTNSALKELLILLPVRGQRRNLNNLSTMQLRRSIDFLGFYYHCMSFISASNKLLINLRKKTANASGNFNTVWQSKNLLIKFPTIYRHLRW